MSIKKNTKHIHRQWQKEKASERKNQLLLIFVSMLKKGINFCVFPHEL